MSTGTQPDQASAANNGPFTSFADQVNYTDLFAGLRQHGIELTEGEKKLCKKICSDGLRKRDGGSLIGNGAGIFESIPYLVMALFKNIAQMLTGHFSDIGDTFSQLGSTVSSTSEQSKLWQLKRDNADIYLRLQHAGGNLAKAAEYITGVKPRDDNSPAQFLSASLLNQVGRSINIPLDTDTSLNSKPTALADASGPGNLPSRSSRQALTTRG